MTCSRGACWCASCRSATLHASHPSTEVQMRRIGLAVVLALSVVLAPLTDEAQQASKVYRVGFLHWGSRGPGEQQFQAFEQALRERGWVTGENLVITYRFAEGQYD